MATPRIYSHFRPVQVLDAPQGVFRRCEGPLELRWVVERLDAENGWVRVAAADERGQRFTLATAMLYADRMEASRIVLLGREEREQQGISEKEYMAALALLNAQGQQEGVENWL